MRTKVNAFLHGSVRVMGLAVVAGMMAACETTTIGEEMEALSDANGFRRAALKVVTRSGESETTIGYPLHVYVFQDGVCKAVQTITSEEANLNIALVEGSYSVCAIGGASAEDYNLPTEAEASPETALTLKEGKHLTDLMAASAQMTLVDGGANEVELELKRKVMQLRTATIRQVPTAATKVEVTIAPLSESLTIGGTYSGDNGEATVSLTKQADGRTWTLDTDPAQTSTGIFLMPPNGSNVRISVAVTIEGKTKSFSHVTDQLAVNHKINIDGTYAEAVGVTLTGTIKGVAWLDDRNISFDLDANSSDGNDNPSTGGDDPASFPAAGDTYQGCYVLASTVAADGQSAELTLLSPNERETTGNRGMTLSTLQAGAADFGTDGIDGWRPMTRSEALLLQAAHIDLGIDGNRYYLFDDNGTVRQMLMDNGSVSSPSPSTAYIRPVAIVNVPKT